MSTIREEHEAQQEVLEDVMKENTRLIEYNKILFEQNNELEKDLENLQHFAKFYRKQINKIYEKGLENVKL